MCAHWAKSEIPEHLLSLWEDARPNLQIEEAEAEAKQLLIEFQEVFAITDFDLGQFRSVKHSIDTGDARLKMLKTQ